MHKDVVEGPQQGESRKMSNLSTKNGEGSSSALDEMKRRSAEHPGVPVAPPDAGADAGDARGPAPGRAAS